MSKSTRKSPTDSATIFKEGTTRKGNDGNNWKVTVTSNGVKRWVLVKKNNTSSNKNIIEKGDNIKIVNPRTNEMIVEFSRKKDLIIVLKFNLKSMASFFKRKIVKLGSINITSRKICIGELMFTVFNCINGKYNVYLLDGSLIVIHEEHKTLNNIIFVDTKEFAECDMGMFGCADYGRIKDYVSKQKRNPRGVYITNEFDYELLVPNMSPNTIKKMDAYYLYTRDLVSNNDETHVDTDKKPVGIFAGNGFGDGSFKIYKSKNAFMILSYPMMELIEDYYAAYLD